MGPGRTCTQPKRALDMCTRGPVLSSRPFSSLCDLLRCARPHFLLMFTPPPVSVSRSIKPFSQQAYSVQTAGTTTISGERLHRTITSFLWQDRRSSVPPLALYRMGFFIFSLCLGPGVRSAPSPQLVLWRGQCQSDFSSAKEGLWCHNYATCTHTHYVSHVC